MAEQLVEQAGFADIRPADDGDPDAASQNLALAGGAEEFVHEGEAVLQALDQGVAGVRGNIFIRKINVGLDVRQGPDHLVTEQVDALREFAGELLIGGGDGQFGAGMDEVGDGFGLGQVDAAIKEGAFGKLARQSEPRATLQECVEDELRREQAAVTRDFHDILPSEGARGAHDGEEDFIHGLGLSDDASVVDGVGWGLGGFERGFADGLEDGVRNEQRARAGETEDGQAALTQGRGDGGDGVIEHEISGRGRRNRWCFRRRGLGGRGGLFRSSFCACNGAGLGPRQAGVER